MTLKNVLLVVLSIAVLVLTGYCLFCPESGCYIWNKQSPDGCSNSNCVCPKCECGENCDCGQKQEIKAYMGRFNKETGEWEFQEVPADEAPLPPQLLEELNSEKEKRPKGHNSYRDNLESIPPQTKKPIVLPDA